MSSWDKEGMMISKSLKFPLKSEIEDPFSPSEVDTENSGLFCSVGLFNDVSHIVDPDKEVKTEPEFFESSEGDMKYPYDYNASVSEDYLQSCKNEINEEEESLKTYLRTGVKEECGIEFEWKGRENSSCEKSLCRESDPKTHYKKHMKVKPFKCNVCGKAFIQKNHLTAHHRIHTGEKAFKCNVCDKAFTDKSNFTRHYKIHTGENAFKCNVCDKAFNEKSNLTRHYKIHAGEKAFKCNVCGKAFIQRDHLTRHYRIHTGEKAFKCNVCGKAFTQKDNLTTHHRIHTGEKASKCK